MKVNLTIVLAAVSIISFILLAISLYISEDSSNKRHVHSGSNPLHINPKTEPSIESFGYNTDISVPNCGVDWRHITFSDVHMVPPPKSYRVLVCCSTTKGDMVIAVYPKWAPRGAERFLDMVTSKFFSSKVALFRALKGFLVQFGLSGDPAVQKEWHKKGSLIDDPSWLPLGPTNREINGVKRFQKGYIAYAGAGKNSRGTQLIIAFEDNGRLCGGSPWEVPFGQVVGEESLRVLGSIYTGYGEKISQGKIMNRGLEYLESEFPLVDYITSCSIVSNSSEPL